MRVILLNYFSFLFLFFFLLESFVRKQEPYVQTIVGRSSAFRSIFLVIFSFPFRSFSFLRKNKIANSLCKTRLVVSEIRKHTREEGHVVLIQSFIKRKTKKKTQKKEKRKNPKKKRRIGIRLCNVHFRL